jgi:hypothetical protein
MILKEINLENKNCYVIIFRKLDKKISIAKTKMEFIKAHDCLDENYKYLVLTHKEIRVYGTIMPRKILVNQNEPIEIKRNFFRFNKNNVIGRDFLIALDKQALVNAIKFLFKTNSLDEKKYKYMLIVIKTMP